MIDFGAMPISGPAFLGCVAYVVASIGAGQLVAERSIERSNWQPRCEAGLKAEIEDRRKPRSMMPRTDCSSVFGWIHPDVLRLCGQYGNPDLGGPAADAELELLRRKQELEDRRLRRAAEEAPNQCSCAATVYARDNLVSLGVYAGTARLISMPAVENMESGLRQALGSGSCSSLTEARS